MVVIEIDPGRRFAIEARGGICLVGDATHDDLLEEAAIEKAKGLIAVTDSDPENLFITLSARQINPDITIVARCLSPDAENKLLRAGANRVILPEKIGAHQMAQAALRPNVVDFIDIATRTSNLDIEIEEMCVDPKADIAGKTLQEATILRSLGLIVIGIRHGARGQMEFNPSAQTRIGPGDTLILLGKRDGLTQLRPYVA
jgi:voltage-gated potassium channel